MYINGISKIWAPITTVEPSYWGCGFRSVTSTLFDLLLRVLKGSVVSLLLTGITCTRSDDVIRSI